MSKKTDVLIVGTGCSGLYCALKLPGNLNIHMITKASVEESDSYLAQGGICMFKEESDYHAFFKDTLRAGHYENNPLSVELMIRSSRAVLDDLLSYGTDFARDEEGNLKYTKEGAHSTNRILYHEDITGKEITSKIYAEVQKRKNITIEEHVTLTDLIVKNGKCVGGRVRKGDEEYDIYANFVVLATGGIGGKYKNSTNYRHLTGDAIDLAKKYGIETEHLDYVQIHPTTFYSEDNERRFLISESVRGEGALLYDKNGNRFVNELLPRDVVSDAIKKQMEKDGTDYVLEDLRPIGEKELKEHFPNIVQYCLDKGYDVTKAVQMARDYAPSVRKIEVEVETFDMVKEAVAAGADIIMLDNMSTELLKQSIDYIDKRAEIEISGNVTAENINRVKDMGVDFISSGALTHSAKILDLSLKNLHAINGRD